MILEAVLAIALQTRVTVEQLRQLRQVRPLIATPAKHTTLSVEQLRIDPTVIESWRRNLSPVGPNCYSLKQHPQQPIDQPVMLTKCSLIQQPWFETDWRGKVR